LAGASKAAPSAADMLFPPTEAVKLEHTDFSI